MKEYSIENNQQVDLNRLKQGLIASEEYSEIQQRMVLPAHDAFIEYEGGILLVKRDNFPAKGELWPLGGALNRGMNTEDSLRKKVREECSLELEDIVLIEPCRMFFQTDPFNHGKGVDYLALVYYAKGKGEVKLDKLHKDPVIVTPERYTSQFREALHPYVRDHVDKSIKRIR